MGIKTQNSPSSLQVQADGPVGRFWTGSGLVLDPDLLNNGESDKSWVVDSRVSFST